MPKDLKPGPHEVQIITVEGASPGGVGAVAGIIFPVRVFVPYPGKYLEIQKYHLNDIAVNETAVFTVNVISRGDQKINDVKLVVNLIYNERIISAVQSKSIKLEKNQDAELTAKWDSTGTPPGIYNAEAVVYYDEKEAKESKELKLGQLRIDILNIKHDKIFSDSIAKFDLELKSVWNSIISDAYIILDISDKDNNPVKQLRGENFAIGPWDRAKQSVYWDTKGVKPGKYKGKFTVSHSSGITSEKSIDFEVSESFFAKYPVVTIILVLVIIILALSIFINAIRLKKGKNEKAV